MAAKTLNEYYTSQGKPLPSIQERASIYQSLGLGDAKSYAGSAQQNTTLLQKLIGGGTPAASPVATVATPSVVATPQTTPNNQTVQPAVTGDPKSVQDLINMGYSGYQGWKDTEAIANFKATGGQGKGGPTNNAGGAIATNQPTINLQEVYKTLYNTPEIAAARASAEAKLKELNDFQASVAEEEANINDNPFNSESNMTGKIAKMRQKAKVKEDTLLKEYNIEANKEAILKADAEVQLNLASQQYQIDSAAYQNNLNRFNTLLSSGALDSASGTDLAQLAVSIGIPASMIQSAVKSHIDEKTPTSVQMSTADSGMVTATVINTKTGEIISQKPLGVIGNAQNGKGSSQIGSTEYRASATSALNTFVQGKSNSYGHLSPTDWNSALNAYLSDALGTKNDFIKAYSSYTDPNRGDFEQAYGFSIGTRNENN